MTMHILFTPAVSAPPFWRTDERLPGLSGERVWTDCCGCKQPSEETDSRIVSYYECPLGGFGDYKDIPRSDSLNLPTGAYYDARLETQCAEGFGCTVNPRKKCGRELREMWRYPL